MIKKDIVDHLYDTHGGITRDDAEQYTEHILGMLKDGLSGDITITDFGRFKQKKKIVRRVRLPNGNLQLSNAGERVQFLPGPKLKRFINSEEEDYLT